MRLVSSRLRGVSRSAKKAKLLGAAALALAVCGVAGASPISFTPFQAGDVIVTRAAGGPGGDGSQVLAGNNTAAQVFLDEYKPDGTFVQSVPMPSTVDNTAGDNHALTFTGGGNTEGQLSLSVNGTYLLLAGYNVAPLATNPSGTTQSAGRTIGRVDWAGGQIDTTTNFSNAFSGVTVRSVASPDGNTLYLTGGSQGSPNGGIQLGTFGSTQTSVIVGTPGGPGDTKSVGIYNGNLYAATIKPTVHGIYNFGTPPTATQTANGTVVPTPVTSANSPADFWFKDANTLYVADIGTGAVGGIDKYIFDGTNWTLSKNIQLGTTGTINTPVHGSSTGAAISAESVSGTVNLDGTVTLYAVSQESSSVASDRLWKITDDGIGDFTQTQLDLSSTNSAFRGVVVLPTATPEPGSLALLALGGLGLLRRSRKA